MIEVILILETADDIVNHIFNSSDGLEDFLKTINLNEYEYTSILFLVDGECHHNMSTIYRARYIDKISKEEEQKLYTKLKKPLPYYD